MNNLIGKQINQYRVEALLGEGGMGAVYRALDVGLDRLVALKIMHPQYASQPEFQQRFAQEARAIARLVHPSVVVVHQIGSQEGLLYIAMEFVPGSTLESYFRQAQQENRRIELREILILLAQVADALDYAHRQGILHRDIKPSNILVRSLEKPDRPGDPPLRAVVTDFGLAKLATGGVETQTGTFMGSLPYLSPEQALGKQLDFRSDIYSLGVVLYQLTTGRLPFDIRTPTEAVLKHMQEIPLPPRQACPELPQAVEAIILKAIAKDLSQRYPTAGEMAAALRSAAADLTQEQVTQYAPPETIVSLVTRLQQSQEEPRGPSIFQEFTPPPVTGKDQVQVLFHGKTILTLPLKPGMTIGREVGNDIHIDDAQISRRHARLEYDGSSVAIVDLNSSNGSFLGDAKLLPGIPEPWLPEKIVRIGSYWLRLVKAAAPAPSPAPPGGRQPVTNTQTSTDPILPPASKIAPPVEVTLENERLFVEPGGSVTASLTVLNQSQRVDHYRVTVEGLPAEWMPSAIPPVQALPGDAREVVLSIRPPRLPTSRAGEYPFTVRVSSVSIPNQSAKASATLVVSPYSQFSSDLFPLKFVSGKSTRLTIKNQGNQSETFTLSWRDPGDELVFKPAQSQLPVPAGQSGVAEIRAEAKIPHWLGKDRSYTFTASAASSEGGSQAHQGEFVSRARFSIVTLIGFLALCLTLSAVGAAGFFILPYLRPALPIPPTTPVSQVIPTTPAPVVAPATVTTAPTIPNAPAPTITNAPAPTVAIAPTPAVFIPDFGGTWWTNFALVELTQTGADVHGKYTWYGTDFSLALDGKVEGSSLVGFFGGKEAQTIKFVMSPDGQSFDGEWSTAQYPHIKWCGVRSGALPDGCGFSGHWLSKSDQDAPEQPTADLTQTGDQVEGEFFNGNTTSRISGTVSGKLGALGNGSQYKLTGTYTMKENGFTGTFRWELVDFSPFQFRGYWSPQEGEVYSWCGWRADASPPGKCLEKVK